jgi:hypothetical protein
MNLNRVKKIIIERLTIFWGKYWILEREKSHSECFSFFTSSFISLPLELLRVCFLCTASSFFSKAIERG